MTALTLAELQLEQPKLFNFALDLTTFLDRDKGYSAFAGGDGIAERCREIHGERGAISPRTAMRNLNTLVELGILEWRTVRIAKRRGRTKDRRGWRLTARWRRAVLLARDLFRGDWCRYWHRKDTEAAKAFTALETPADSESADKNGDEGEASSTQPKDIKPSAETSESPTLGREEDSDNFFGMCAEGCADAPPADLEAPATPATPERSSAAPLHPRDAAAPLKPAFPAIERRRGDPSPDGPTLKGYKRKLWRDDIARFVQERELYAEQSALWAAEMAGDEVALQQLLDNLDARMRAGGWRSPPEVRTKRRLHRRGDKRDPAERERAKQRLAAKVARWLGPAKAADFWRTMTTAPADVAPAIFDKLVAAMRASGWQDKGDFGRGHGRVAHRALWTEANPAPAAEVVPVIPSRARTVPAHVAERERARREEAERRRQFIYGGLE